jgi:hypothetical protein
LNKVAHNTFTRGAKHKHKAPSTDLLAIHIKSPTYSILASVVTDVFAILPTYKKTRRSPQSETRISWLIGTFNALLATISVGKLDWRLIILPGMATISQIQVVYLLYFNLSSAEKALG